MTTAREDLVDPEVTRWYHCISRCVRGLHLLGLEGEVRKHWIDERLEELTHIFAISCAGFATMDNHLHLVLRLDPEISLHWSPREVAQRWAKLFPPKDKKRKPLESLEEWIGEKANDEAWIEEKRSRLGNLGWFMKCLKEPIARRANQADKIKGVFWEPRFKSIGILDEAALLVACTYVDLNPLAAGMVKLPEDSKHTSFAARMAHVKELGRTEDLFAGTAGAFAGSMAADGLEDSHWLCPIENRQSLGASREGMQIGFPLSSYVQLLDTTGRMYREGKATIDAGALPIFERLGLTADYWEEQQRTMREGNWFGRVFSTSKEKLTAAAEKLGVKRLRNLSQIPAF